MYTCDLGRMADKITTMSKFGDAGHGGITRYSLSPEALQARGEFVKRMEAIGAEIKTDDMANVYATLKGSEPDLPNIVMASHCDSVKNGGNYDGILGVMGAMEVLETIADQEIPHKHNITAMIWTNEEGSLYPPAMMSSGVICNDYLPDDIKKNFLHENMLASKSVLEPEKTFGEALEASGYKGARENRLNNKDYMAMFELHIEQGPVLEQNQKDIGIVDAIVSLECYDVLVRGRADHAGTTPIDMRADALLAAAKAIAAATGRAAACGDGTVITFGCMDSSPKSANVVPSQVTFTADCRSSDIRSIRTVMEAFRETLRESTEHCPDLSFEISRTLQADPAAMDMRLKKIIEDTADELSLSSMHLLSGAGHDTMNFKNMCPLAMIFVPSKGGRSHCPEEWTDYRQISDGADVLLRTIIKAAAHEI